MLAKLVQEGKLGREMLACDFTPIGYVNAHHSHAPACGGDNCSALSSSLG
jgi:hypothetical protein